MCALRGQVEGRQVEAYLWLHSLLLRSHHSGSLQGCPEFNQLFSIEKKSGRQKVHSRGSFPVLEPSLECPPGHPSQLLMASPSWSPGLLQSWTWVLPLMPPVTTRCGSLLWSEGCPVEWNKRETSQHYAPIPRWNTKLGDTTWLGKPAFVLWFEALEWWISTDSVLIFKI